ncbi:MAG: hypothetical protein AB2A00_09680 [Myxococcota bacterium]
MQPVEEHHPFETAMSHDDVVTWPLNLPAGKTLEFHSDFCAVTLQGITDGREPCVVAHGRLARQIEVVVEDEGGSVAVRVERRAHGLPGWGFWEWGPHMHVTLFLPVDVRAEVHNEAGRVRVHGLNGCDLELSTEAGHVTLHDVHGKLTLHTSAGKLDGDRVGGTLEITTNAGAVRLGIDALDAGRHRVHADVGSVRLDLAPTVDAYVDAHATMGAIKVDHPSRRDAPAVLEVSTELGSVRVRGNREHRAERPRRAERREGEARAAGGVSSVAVPAYQDTDAEMVRILQMVEAGKITAQEAHDLLRALGRG